MIRRETFGGMIYDDETGKVYVTDKYSFRALEMLTIKGLKYPLKNSLKMV